MSQASERRIYGQTWMFRLRCGRPLGLAVLLATAVCLPPAPARADDDATVVARERFKEGVAYFDQKQYDKARLAFLQAYALRRHPAVLLNLAHSELLSGHEAAAAKHFSMYLREAKNPSEAERQGAENGLLAAKAVVGEVEVEVEVEGADVYVNGELAGRSPLPDPVFVEPGTHRIEAKKGGRTVSTEITSVAGQATSATLRFEAKPAIPPGRAHAPSRGDGESTERDEAGAGSGRKAFLPWVGETPLAWVGSGLTALGIGGGVGFAVAARVRYDNANSIVSQINDNADSDAPGSSHQGICRDPLTWLINAGKVDPEQRAAQYEKACQKFTDNQNSGDKMKTLSIVSWIVAGGAALAKAYTWRSTRS
jgi:tetratricopeptide (TPR) repeat protein